MAEQMDLIPATGLKELSIEASRALGLPEEARVDLLRLPARLDDATLATLAIIADCPLPVHTPVERDHFDKCMRSLAILPRKADDELKGRLRLQLYWRKLKEYPAEAHSWLVDRGLETFEWFPSIKQCLSLIATWPNADRARNWRSLARRRIEVEREARYQEIRRGIKWGEITGSQVMDLPIGVLERLVDDRMVLEEVGGDGSRRFTIRPGACWVEEAG